jgi:CSLREA domain-containing protein
MQGGRNLKIFTRARHLALLTVAAAALSVVVAPAAQAGTIQVNTTTDEFTTGGDCSLREAVFFANDDTTPNGCTETNGAPADDDTIILQGGDYNLTRPSTLVAGTEGTKGDLDVSSNVTVVGTGPDTTGIDGNGATILDRVFEVTAGTLKLNRVRVHDGSSQPGQPGGGILAMAAATALVLNNSDVVGNTAATSGGGISSGAPVTLTDGRVVHNSAGTSGGGISGTPAGATTTLVSATVSSNSAGAGGGGGLSVGIADITGSTISDNTATGGNGGGVLAVGNAELATTFVNGNTSTGSGGGVQANAITLTDSAVSENTATGNGGGASSNTTTTATNSQIERNSSLANGGGIATSTTAMATASLVADNKAANGGGINATTVNLILSTVRNNNATTGNGGGLVGGGLLDRSTLRQNIAAASGGGTYTSTAGTTLTIDRTTIAGNDSLDGGATWFMSAGGFLNVKNSTLSGNEALNAGGALHVSQGTAHLSNATIYRNAADADNSGVGNGGGLFSTGPPVAIDLKNTILAGNSAFAGSDCFDGGAGTSLGNNIIGIADGCSIAATTGDQFGTSGSPINPRLGFLNDNGGPTSTHALNDGSPAINNGAGCEPTDQRGISRSLGGSTCDVGAFEATFCRGFIVTKLGSNSSETIRGTSARDVIWALGGNDTVKGGGGNDIICGGNGADVLKGGDGNDRLYGDAGNDTLNGGAGSDRCVGGPGTDTRTACES